MSVVRALLRRSPAAPRPVLLALAVAAVAIAVGGYEHYRLWSDGYRLIPNIGTAFLLNVIGSASVIVLLLARRDLLFALGGLSISIGSIVGLVMSRNGGFLGFQELGYDRTATITLTAEVVATAVLVGVLLYTAARRAQPEPLTSNADASSPPATSATVTRRSRSGVSHDQQRVAR